MGEYDAWFDLLGHGALHLETYAALTCRLAGVRDGTERPFCTISLECDFFYDDGACYR
jgi:hypothetical protein